MENYCTYDKQLKGCCNGPLDSLLEEWKATYSEEEQERFCKDGLVMKYGDETGSYDVNRMWAESKRRIMVIVKDCPDGYGYDARTLLVGSGDQKSLVYAENTRSLRLRSSFFRNIASLLYGLAYLSEDNGVSNKSITKEMKIKAINEIPFAFVEAKKLAGGKRCSDQALFEALKRDGVFLSREIDILKPNIIVCCDNNGLIFNNIVENHFHGVVPDAAHQWRGMYIDDNGVNHGFEYQLYYYEKEGVLLFKSYHPSFRVTWKLSERVLSPFRKFFTVYKTFNVISEKEKSL